VKEWIGIGSDRPMTSAIGELLARLAALLKSAGLWWGVAASVVLAVGSILLAIAIAVGWSADHFKREKHPRFWDGRHPAVRALGLVAKNLTGVLLVMLGLVMSLPGVPGQGILTILIGVTLLDLPGKRGIERRLIRLPWVLRPINRLRTRFHRPALEVD
jgi:hypothetical protein